VVDEVGWIALTEAHDALFHDRDCDRAILDQLERRSARPHLRG
jgi:hypothetical protein